MKKIDLIGMEYEDPEGIWEITDVLLNNRVEITQMQEDNIDYGYVTDVDIKEVLYFICIDKSDQ
jgi:hypothetical protein